LFSILLSAKQNMLMKGTGHRKMRIKTYAAAGWPYRNERSL
jgi:hypothetical protein